MLRAAPGACQACCMSDRGLTELHACLVCILHKRRQPLLAPGGQVDTVALEVALQGPADQQQLPVPGSPRLLRVRALTRLHSPALACRGGGAEALAGSPAAAAGSRQLRQLQQHRRQAACEPACAHTCAVPAAAEPARA